MKMKAPAASIPPWSGNITGAFADGAVLFPLLALLALQTGMNGAMLLASAGIAYVAAGLVFRMPMPVQPLKSVVVAAIALGATAAEVRWSGLAVGAVCLMLSFCQADRLAALVPRHLVHGLQMALGVILIVKGMESGLSGPGLPSQLTFGALAGAVIALSLWTQKPLMGWIATAGIVAGLFSALHQQPPVPPAADHAVRTGILIALVLPQLVLTLANSVIGTHDAARRYFGNQAKLVRSSWLLRSIGAGNVLAAALGGLPFCHGAGGLTAHVRGGARDWRMNLVIGGVLLVLAMASFLLDIPVIPAYPGILTNVLLAAIGWFHLGLAQPSWQQKELRWLLAAMALTALATQNMLWTLAAGVGGEALRRLLRAQLSRMTE